MGTVLEQEGYQSVDDDGFCVFWVRCDELCSYLGLSEILWLMMSWL